MRVAVDNISVVAIWAIARLALFDALSKEADTQADVVRQ